MLADPCGLLQGQRVAVDATTLKPTRPCVWIVRRDTGESLGEPARAFGEGFRHRDADARGSGAVGRRRKKRIEQGVEEPCGRGCAGGEDEGRAHAPGAQGRAHPVGLDTGAVVAVTLQAADQGDAATLEQLLCDAGHSGGGVAGTAKAELRPEDYAQGERQRDPAKS